MDWVSYVFPFLLQTIKLWLSFSFRTSSVILFKQTLIKKSVISEGGTVKTSRILSTFIKYQCHHPLSYSISLIDISGHGYYLSSSTGINRFSSDVFINPIYLQSILLLFLQGFFFFGACNFVFFTTAIISVNHRTNLKNNLISIFVEVIPRFH